MLCQHCIQRQQHHNSAVSALDASNNQQVGQQAAAAELSEQCHSSAGGEQWQCASLCHVVPVLHWMTAAS